jgi:hypothetical protein
MSGADVVAYAIKISEVGAARLCAQRIVSPDEVISRRPYRCAICGGIFITQQFDKVRTMSGERHEARPFETAQPIHEGCRSEA